MKLSFNKLLNAQAQANERPYKLDSTPSANPVSGPTTTTSPEPEKTSGGTKPKI